MGLATPSLSRATGAARETGWPHFIGSEGKHILAARNRKRQKFSPSSRVFREPDLADLLYHRLR